MTDTPLNYDLIVIGSGPAGEKGAAKAAFFGKKVALVERAPVLGGTMTGGGVPAKVLRETALNITGLRQKGLYGIDFDQRSKLDISVFMHRERQVQTAAQNAVGANLDKHKVDRYQGTASFLDPHTVLVDAKPGQLRLKGERILIATGSRPNRPASFPFYHPYVFDSDALLNIDRLPKHLAIIGAGVVGCEFACLFGALGIPVTLINSHDRLFPFVDKEVIEALEASLPKLNVTLLAKERVGSITPNESDQSLTLALSSGRVLHADAVLVAVGRHSNIEALDLEKAGVATGPRGLITVNDAYQTTAPHIYAAGDVIGPPALSSTSMEQARNAIDHAFELAHNPYKPKFTPYGIWTIPEISTVGETQDALDERGADYVVGKAYYRENPRGLLLGEKHGFVKLLFCRETQKLLGAHIIGPEACELIGLGLFALEGGFELKQLVHSTFNFPSLNDMFKYAAFDALSQFESEA